MFIVGTNMKELTKEKRNQVKNLMGGLKYFTIVNGKQISEDVPADLNCQVEKNSITINTALTSMFHMEIA